MRSFCIHQFIQALYIVSDRSICNALAKCNKVRILTYEICFAAYTNHYARFMIICCLRNYHTFFCFTVTAFSGDFLTLLS